MGRFRKVENCKWDKRAGRVMVGGIGTGWKFVQGGSEDLLEVA